MADQKFHKPTPKEKKQLNSWVKYSALGFQMLGVIGLFTWLGWWLDKKLATETPWFTIALSLFGVIGGIYLGIKDLIKGNSDEGFRDESNASGDHSDR